MVVERSSAGVERSGACEVPPRSRAPLVRRLLSLLLVLALVVGALGQTQAVWMCEGRVCSPDLARCCCVSAAEIRDNACFGATKEKPKGFCTGKCRCKPSVTAPNVAVTADVEPFANAVPFQVDHVAVLSPPLDLSPTFALFDLPCVKPMPPPRGVSRPFAPVPSLRAPPPLA